MINLLNTFKLFEKIIDRDNYISINDVIFLNITGIKS